MRLKEILKSKGITQLKFSELIGIRPEALSRILADRGNPNMLIIQKMANILDVNIGDLFENEKEEKKICGYLEFNDKICKINSIEDLDKFYKKFLKTNV